jgi:hypothetical protein
MRGRLDWHWVLPHAARGRSLACRSIFHSIDQSGFGIPERITEFEVKTPRPIALLFALIVVPASVVPLNAPAFGAEQNPGGLLDVKAHADVERLTDVTRDPGDKTAENEQTAAARELRYLNCLCNRCGPSGGEFTRDPKDDCDGGCTCVAPCSPFCTPVPVGEKVVMECYGSVFEVKDPSPVEVQRGLDNARIENRRTLEAALNRQLGGNRLDNAAWTAESALRNDPGLQSPMLDEVGRRAKAAGLEALDKGDRELAIKRLEQAVRLLPADDEARAKLAEAKEHGATVSATK